MYVSFRVCVILHTMCMTEKFEYVLRQAPAELSFALMEV